MLKCLKEMFGEKKCEAVHFDEERVTRTMSNGHTETVRWDALTSVMIVTTDEGPFVEDLYWLLAADDHGCAVAGGADGMPRLLARLQQLPGFDNKAVIDAMACTVNHQFVVWTRGAKTQSCASQTAATCESQT